VNMGPYRGGSPDPYLVEWERLRRKFRTAKHATWILGLPWIAFGLMASGHWLSLRCVPVVIVGGTITWFWMIPTRFLCPNCGHRYMTFKRGQPSVAGERDLNLRCGHCDIVFGTPRSDV
jgi:hypothetical protein